jgi:glucose-6-phosphate-specific signal transduction histidine kinase
MSLPPPIPPGSKRAYWICQLVGWYGYGLALVIVVAAASNAWLPSIGMKIPVEAIAPLPSWQRAALEMLALCSGGIVISHHLRQFALSRRWDALRPKALVPRILGVGLLVSPLLGVPTHFLAVAALQQLPGNTPPWLALVQHAINWAPLFWIWMTVYFIVLGSRKRRYAELRQSELARELQAAELRLLKAQLNPHFLFNSLNSVRALISEDPSRAQHAVTQLARTLRYTLGSSGQEELVTLEQELEMVGDYLGLESLRLGERLKIEREISKDAMRVRIPVMLLQTVVENAIKHGIAELPAGGVLRIDVQIRDGALMLEVENPRPAGPAHRAGEGVGLRNGAERLRLLFGAEAGLDLDLSSAGRAIARIRIPARP